MRNALRPNF